MNKKISLGAAICFMAIIAAITFTFTMYYSLNIFNNKVANVSEREELYTKVAEIDTIVRNNFLEKIDEQELIDNIANGYMAGLNDPYSYYMTQEEYKSYQMENSGELVGIGINAKLDESGYILVVSINEGTPAEAAGLLPDDLIIKVDDKDVLTVGYAEAMASVKGEEGTKVSLTIRREGEESVLELTRKKMKLNHVSYRMIGENGYVKITNFDANTPEDFKFAVSELTVQGAKGFIFDVRNNPGGLVSSVAEVLDYLLPEGDLVSQTNRKKESKVLYTSDADFVDLPMVVLVNGDTASAGELFACDLRDFKVAELVGENTFGKGIMQTAYPLEDGSAINTTTAYYNPHSGVNFHGVGLKPDYEVVLTTDQKANLLHLDETNDPQLQKAIEVIGSR